MTIRISHCSTSLLNYYICLDQKVSGFLNKGSQSGELIYLVVKVDKKSYCGARFILDKVTDNKPWGNSEKYVVAYTIKDIEYCKPFDISILSQIGGSHWSLKYVQGAKPINDNNVINLLDKEFKKNKTKKLIKLEEFFDIIQFKLETSHEKKNEIDILYTANKGISSKLKNDSIIIQKVDFDDFGYKTLCNLYVIKENKMYHLSNYKILIKYNKNTHDFLKENLEDEVVSGYFKFELKSLKFISLGSFETYKQLKEILSQSQVMYFLEKMNDLVYLKNIKKSPWELFESIVMPGLEESLLRTPDFYKAYDEYEYLLWNEIKLKKKDFNFELGYKLDGFVSEHLVDFNFDDELYPSNITILIGKNGTGKSQALKAIFERFLGSGFDTYKPKLFSISKRPAFSKIIVVSYSHFEELYKVDSMPEIDRSSYKYCGFKDSMGTINLDKVNIETCEALINLIKQDQNNFLKDWINKLNKSIEILNTAVKFDSYYFLVEKGKSRKNYLEYFETIEIKDSIYLKVPQDIEGITDLELYISKEYIKLKEVKLFYKNEEVKLSAGQKIFLYLVINIISAIKKESLILIDEPETHLHPNMEITFMFLLKEILEYFNSYAIIATHSMIITREIPSKFVRIFIKNSENIPVINTPVMETFGADISAICNEVFDNALEEKPYQKWLLEKFKNKSFEEISKDYGDKLNPESLIYLRNMKDD